MIYILLVAVVLGILFIILFAQHKKKLSASEKAKFQRLFHSILAQSEVDKQIIQLDSLLCKVLVALGYTGSFGEILKQKPKELSNIQDIWFAHKLRNTLAHEVGYKLGEKEGEKAANIFSQAISRLLK